MDYPSHHDDYPVVLLDSPDPEFRRGCEAGMLWFVLTSHPDKAVETTVGRSNVEMVLRMADATKRQFHTEDRPECRDHLHFHFDECRP